MELSFTVPTWFLCFVAGWFVAKAIDEISKFVLRFLQEWKRRLQEKQHG